MIRPVSVFVMASFILLSQVGLPVHMHYCKGLLESASVFFQQGCDDHAEVADLPACCQKASTGHCSKEDDNCCDDQVALVTQDLRSLTPQYIKWVDVVFDSVWPQVPEYKAPKHEQPYSSLPFVAVDTGPPIYILHHALVFYA